MANEIVAVQKHLSTGDSGEVGPTGATGVTGPAGAKGDDGATGATGPAGAKGDDGATGATGPAGAKGDDGATGATGPAGDPGAKGDPGIPGPPVKVRVMPYVFGSEYQENDIVTYKGALYQARKTGKLGYPFDGSQWILIVDRGAPGMGGGGGTSSPGPPGPKGDPGPTGPAGSQSSEDIKAVAGEAIHAGQPVYVNQVDTLAYRAEAVLGTTSQICGFCRGEVLTGGTFDIVPVGGLELTDWSIPLGGIGLLTPGAIYYLDAVSGQITTIPPASGFVVQVGVAMTTTLLDINIKTRVRL
jgi:hypothetical protein